MEKKFDKEPTRDRLQRILTEWWNANKISIDWKAYRRSARKFIASAALTMIGIGIGAWLLLFINTTTLGDLSAVACQALSGIASFPLMAVSSLVLTLSGLLAALFLTWLPRTGKLGQLGEVIKASYKGIADFSIQLPLAIGGVAIASVMYSKASPTLLWLFPLGLGLSSAQKFVFSIIFYSNSKPSGRGKLATTGLALTALAGFTCFAMNLDWRPFLYTPPLCN